MKTINYLLMFMSVYLFLGCEKQTTSNFNLLKEAKDSEELLYYNLLEIDNYSDRSLSYSMLSNQERYDVWKKRIDDFLKLNLSKEQRILINNFKSYLNESLFEDGDSKEIFKNVWLPKWIKESNTHFNEYTINTLIFTLNPLSNKLLSQPDKVDFVNKTTNPEEPCNCAVGSNYTCYYNINNVIWGFGECLITGKGECIEASRGCGALLDDRCDGNFCIIT